MGAKCYQLALDEEVEIFSAFFGFELGFLLVQNVCLRPHRRPNMI